MKLGPAYEDVPHARPAAGGARDSLGDRGSSPIGGGGHHAEVRRCRRRGTDHLTDGGPVPIQEAVEDGPPAWSRSGIDPRDGVGGLSRWTTRRWGGRTPKLEARYAELPDGGGDSKARRYARVAIEEALERGKRSTRLRVRIHAPRPPPGTPMDDSPRPARTSARMLMGTSRGSGATLMGKGCG